MPGESLDAERLGGVVAAVQDVQPEFFGRGVGPVRAFAGDEGVHAFLRRQFELGAGAACHHADATACGRAAGQQFDRVPQNPGEALDQCVARFACAGLESEPRAAVEEEWFEPAKAEGGAEPGVVAELRMRVERQVGAVEGEIGAEQELHLSEPDPGPGLRGIPEEAVVDQEQVGPNGGGAADGGEAGIDGGGDARDGALVFDLQSIYGAVPILEATGLQQAIAVGNDSGERDGYHGAMKAERRGVLKEQKMGSGGGARLFVPRKIFTRSIEILAGLSIVRSV
jgi:hypothetical protein